MGSRPLAVALLGLAFLAGGCSPLLDRLIATPDPRQALLAELADNVARWEEAGVQRYAFTYAPSCFCDMTRRLVVGDGETVRIDGVAVDAAGVQAGTPAGVPGLFALVRRAIEGDRVTVSYDPATGVPVRMDSDPIVDAIDDELSFTVVDWTLDPPDDTLLGRVTAARTRWELQAVPRYTMTVRIRCSCVHDGRSFVSSVTDGDVVVTSDGRRVEVDDLEGVPLRVDELFDFAVSVSTNGRTSIEFDERLGVPTSIVVAPDPNVAGQDETIEVELKAS